MTILKTRQEIETRVIEVLNDITQDWGLELDSPIGLETRIIDDLGFESIDLVQLVVAIDEAFGTRGLPYDQALMEDGSYVTEIRVEELVRFLEANIADHRVVTAAQ